MKKKAKIASLIISVLFLFTILFAYYLLNNEDFLLNLMISQNSKKAKSYAFERVLKISKKKDVVKLIVKNLEEGTNKKFNSYYILLLGVIGDDRALSTLYSLYVECQDNTNDPPCITKQYFSVTSLGLLGDENALKFLETILNNYDKHSTQVRRQIFARSLYFLTGKQYNYINDDGVERKFELWNSLIEAREVIEKSKNRVRTINEMMILYNAI